MTDFVRVRDQRTGHEYSVTPKRAAKTKELEVLKGQKAVDDRGRPLPAVHAKPKATPKAAATTENKES